MEFIISGLLLLIYSIHTFCRNKLLLPSVVFCIMWGIAFMLCGLIQSDYIFADVCRWFPTYEKTKNHKSIMYIYGCTSHLKNYAFIFSNL